MDCCPYTENDGDDARLVDGPSSALHSIRVPFWLRSAVLAMHDYHGGYK